MNEFQAPIVDSTVKVENGVMFGKHRVEDLKKDFYQLVATTTDPNVVSVSLRTIHFSICFLSALFIHIADFFYHMLIKSKNNSVLMALRLVAMAVVFCGKFIDE